MVVLGAGLLCAQDVEDSSHRLKNWAELSAECCEAWDMLGDPSALSVEGEVRGALTCSDLLFQSFFFSDVQGRQGTRAKAWLRIMCYIISTVVRINQTCTL